MLDLFTPLLDNVKLSLKFYLYNCSHAFVSQAKEVKPLSRVPGGAQVRVRDPENMIGIIWATRKR